MLEHTDSQRTGMENRLSSNRLLETGGLTHGIPYRAMQAINRVQKAAELKIKSKQGCYYL